MIVLFQGLKYVLILLLIPLISEFFSPDVSAQICPDINEPVELMRIAIVIDHSTELSRGQREAAKGKISKALNFVNRNDSLEIIITQLETDHQLNSTVHQKYPIERNKVKGCPGCNKFLGTCLTQRDYINEIDKHEEFIKNFNDEILSNADSLLRLDPEDDSPILRKTGSLDYDMCNEKCDQLWIISDMLENSSQFNFYESIQSFQNAKSEIKRHFGFPQNIDSTIVFNINRCHGDGGEIQESDNFEPFWNDYFTHVTGREPIWEYLPTGGDCAEQDDS